MIQHILFDLDGTLTDSADGITRCIAHAVTSLGGSSPPHHELNHFIGSPLREILASLLDTADGPTLDRAIVHYRERFDSKGFAENRVYDGVVDLLLRLRERGYRLYVATAKRQMDAARIIDHFELGGHFEAVFGVETEPERQNKAVLVARIVSDRGLAAEQVAMVGDRSHDMLAARETGVRAIGAGWGYGSTEELRDAGAESIVAKPGEVFDLLAG